MTQCFHPVSLFAFGLPGHGEWLILLALGLLIFGRRLPEVGRWVGQSIVEFKRGVKGIQDDVDVESTKATTPPLPSNSGAQQIADRATQTVEENPYARVEQPVDSGSGEEKQS